MMQKEETRLGFVQTKLPWIAAGGVLVLFLLTLNHWVNLQSLQVVAKVTGWDWSPPVQWPVFFTVTFPFRWLPATWQALALNVFSALTAGLTLVLLARSVALLPHDRTHDQRIRERSDFSLLSIQHAWLPPVLAVLVCGLQLTFWEHATVITGEMLALLMFAYCVRCLLEYRISLNERWLIKFALVYGLGVTNNWAMIAFFPAFLVALVWIMGRSFFRLNILGKMALAGITGLLLYLLLPIIWVATQETQFTLLDVLRTNLASQKTFLVDASVLRNRALLLSLTSILPLLLIGIRWPSSFGDTSAAGASLTIVMFRLVHLFFLGVCLWVAFDPKFSPRELGYGVPFLTFYYLAALAIGYYAGYTLLVFTPLPKKSYRRQSDLTKAVNPLIRAAVWAVLIAVPAGLIYQNLPKVRAANGTLLRDYMARTVKALPSRPAYILSDDPAQILLLEGYIRGTGATNEHVMVNTRSLELPSYHEQLSRHYGQRWPGVGPAEDHGKTVEHPVLQRLVSTIIAEHPMVYLHPSFGYFFERVYATPEGQVYPLSPYAPDQVLPPAITPRIAELNQEYWASLQPDLQKVSALARQNVKDAVWVAGEYSRSINNWGVEMQKMEKLPEAAALFSTALELNTNNVAAHVNLQFNQILQSGSTNTLDPKTLQEQFGLYRTVDILLSENGAFDEPRFRSWLGSIFMSQSLFRQSIQQFVRVAHFQPTNFQARTAIARGLVYGHWPDEALAQVKAIRNDFPSLSLTNSLDLLNLEATIYYAKEDLQTAEEILSRARTENPGNLVAAKSLYDFYRTSRRWTNALEVLDTELRASPTNVFIMIQKAETFMAMQDFAAAHRVLDEVLEKFPANDSALLYKAFIHIQQKQYDQALPWARQVLQKTPGNRQALLYRGISNLELKNFEEARKDLDAVLKEEPSHTTALRNRALLNLRTERYKEAKEDYEALRQVAPRSYAVHYGLAEIAYQQKDFEKAVAHYERYLKYLPEAVTDELKQEREQVLARLGELKKS